jgi:hypothetical protein
MTMIVTFLHWYIVTLFLLLFVVSSAKAAAASFTQEFSL